MAQLWLNYGSSMAQVWLKSGSSIAQLWLQYGSILALVSRKCGLRMVNGTAFMIYNSLKF